MFKQRKSAPRPHHTPHTTHHSSMKWMDAPSTAEQEALQELDTPVPDKLSHKPQVMCSEGEERKPTADIYTQVQQHRLGSLEAAGRRRKTGSSRPSSAMPYAKVTNGYILSSGTA